MGCEVVEIGSLYYRIPVGAQASLRIWSAMIRLIFGCVAFSVICFLNYIILKALNAFQGLCSDISAGRPARRGKLKIVHSPVAGGDKLPNDMYQKRVVG